jgi:hypothetical protein
MEHLLQPEHDLSAIVPIFEGQNEKMKKFDTLFVKNDRMRSMDRFMVTNKLIVNDLLSSID